MLKTRPLCFVCLLILLVEGIIMLVTGGTFLTNTPADSIFYKGIEETVTIHGQVYKKSITSNYQIYYLKNNSTNDSKLIVYDSHFMNIPIGKTITIQGTLGFFEHARNPGNFDQKNYYARQKIHGVIWLDKLVGMSGERYTFAETLYEIKVRWRESLVQTLGEKNGGILSAMLLGDKEYLEKDMRELYQNNGISHVLAISGLHISFIGLGIYKIFRKIGIGFAGAGILSMSILGCYMVMIGFSVSSFRACMMLLIKILADITGRIYDMLTATMFAATITILYQPLYLYDAGFYMSYGAILGILIILPAMKETLRIRNQFLVGMQTSLAINISLFPVTLWFYYTFPTYSMLTNAIVLPFMGIIMGLGMFGSFLLVFAPSIGHIVLSVCGWVLRFYEYVCRKGSALPFSRIVFGRPMWWMLVIYYLVLILILLVLKFKKLVKRRQIWLALVFVVVLFGCLPENDLQITMLDVGQGDGIFMCGPDGTTYMIDGGSSDVSNVGQYRIEPYLLSQGFGTLDYVFISHGDGDHYSGIEEMLGRQQNGIRIKNIVMPANYRENEDLTLLVEKALREGTRVYVINRGDMIEHANVKISCIQPANGDKKLMDNEGSMVLEVLYHNFSMLFTGDVEGDGEDILIGRLRDRKYDILKIAHHGSKNSTSEEFLSKTNPKIALISAGIDNRYHHPHKEVTERLKKRGIHIINTQKNGAISIRTDGNSLTIW